MADWRLRDESAAAPTSASLPQPDDRARSPGGIHDAHACVRQCLLVVFEGSRTRRIHLETRPLQRA